MIEINLLGRTLENEQRQRRRFQVEAAVVILILTSALAVCGAIWMDLDRSLRVLQHQIKEKTVQLVKLKQVQEQLEVMHQKKTDLVARSHQVIRLAAQQRRSIQLLDTVSRNLNPLKLWLSNLEMEKEHVTLMGYAESKSQVVEFAKNLKQDGFFSRCGSSRNREGF